MQFKIAQDLASAKFSGTTDWSQQAENRKRVVLNPGWGFPAVNHRDVTLHYSDFADRACGIHEEVVRSFMRYWCLLMIISLLSW